MNQKHQLSGFAWFTLSLGISCINDTLTKLLGENIHPWQIVFVRLSFATLPLLPYAITHPIHTRHRSIHLLRGAGFMVASALWNEGLTKHAVTIATAMSFTIPLFTFLLAVFLLKEKITLRLALCTCIGFIGAAIVLHPARQQKFQPHSAVFVASAIIFAFLDLLNKHYSTKESLFAMLFFSNITALCISLPLAISYWNPLTTHQIALGAFLGLGSNLIIYALLKAYRHTPLVALSPLRYIELLISIALSIAVFNEKPVYEFWGSLLIIPAVCCIMYDQQKKSTKP